MNDAFVVNRPAATRDFGATTRTNRPTSKSEKVIMPSKTNRFGEDDNDGSQLAGLLSDIRQAERTLPAAIQRRTGRTFARPMDDYRGRTNCQCGKPKRANSPLCPECAYEQGYIDQATLASNLAFLQGRNTDVLCGCGNAKIAREATCKRCAIQAGRIHATIEPGQIPCPGCGDGRKPEFAYCTGCAKARGLLNNDGIVTAASPTNQCSCGRHKPAAYSRCVTCHANHPAEISDVLEEVDAAHCERCGGPVNAAKRFCRRCMDEMGAPPEAYDDAFNDRRKC